MSHPKHSPKQTRAVLAEAFGPVLDGHREQLSQNAARRRECDRRSGCDAFRESLQARGALTGRVFAEVLQGVGQRRRELGRQGERDLVRSRRRSQKA